MIPRLKKLPKKSFILLGPRGVGKSTLIKQQIKPALEINLLRSKDYISLGQNPDRLLEMTTALKEGDWVFIDEVQRVPEILNVVHDIYESRRIHFALSGSSARKIKRGGGNLLAGRALQAFLYPFVYPEFYKNQSIEDAIIWGTLPVVVTQDEYRKDTLATYVETYLREELIQEGIIRKIDSFLRFLQIAGLLNGQILNYENVSREAHLGRTTIQTYFDVLIETLIGFHLPSYQPAMKVKEISKPKFYFFDSGVARACADLLSYDVDPSYKGYLFETLIINQIRAYNDYSGKKLGLYYYGVSSGFEVDLIIETKKRSPSKKAEIIPIEIKMGRQFKREWLQGIKSIRAQDKITIGPSYCVYLGNEKAVVNGVNVLSAEDFLKKLFKGESF